MENDITLRRLVGIKYGTAKSSGKPKDLGAAYRNRFVGKYTALGEKKSQPQGEANAVEIASLSASDIFVVGPETCVKKAQVCTASVVTMDGTMEEVVVRDCGVKKFILLEKMRAAGIDVTPVKSDDGKVYNFTKGSVEEVTPVRRYFGVAGPVDAKVKFTEGNTGVYPVNPDVLSYALKL